MLAADRSRKFEQVLAGYLEAKERGEAPDRAGLLRAHPDIADDLREYFANEERLASAAGGLGAKTAPKRSAGARVGEYEILGEIARGGMGVVYRARHVRLQRVVALKMMLAGEFAGSDGLRRFHAEAEVVAALDHPSIVPIYDVGAHDGHAYYAMKLIDGPSLRERIGDYAGNAEEAARIVITVARAVHHAHQRGILHRDLKPGNILLAPSEAKRTVERKKDKYPVAGIPRHALYSPKTVTPFVTDFGLAKRVRGDGLVSHSTAIVGTAAYMAPEQATGKAALSVAADVYSLGAMLFEILTGRPPFVGDNQMEVLLQAIEKEPPSPLELQPRLDPDLAQVCLKCLRKNPDDRYHSAEALADELEHWLEGESLSVRAPTRAELLGRYCRRHPWAALAGGVIALLTLALIGGTVGVNWHLRDLNEQLVEANRIADENKRLAEKKAETETTSRIDAEKAKLDLQETLAKEKAAREAEVAALERRRQLLVQQYVANGQLMTQRGDAGSAAIWFAAALEQDQGNAERELPHRVRLGAVLHQLPTLAQMWFLDAKPRFVRLSPIGDRLCIVRKDGGARLWNAQTGQEVGAPLAADATVNAVEFSPDGRFVVFGGADGIARLHGSKTGAAHGKVIKHESAIHAVAFSADSKTLATGSADKTVRLWETETGNPVGKTLTHKQEIRLVAFHPVAKKLLTYSENIKNKNGELFVWDLTTGRDSFLPWPTKEGALAADFSRDGQRIFAVSSAHKLFLWQPSGQSLTPTMNPVVKGDHGHWLTPGADRLVVPVDADVKVRDLPGGATALTLAHESPVYLAEYSVSGKFIVSATANRGLRLWRADSGQPVGQALPHPQLIVSVQFSRDDRWLATLSEDHCVRLWDLGALENETAATVPKGKGTLVALSPDGVTMLLAQTKGAILWDVARAKQVGPALALPGAILQTAWAGDGRTLAIATREEARVFDGRTGKPISFALKLDKMDDSTLHLHHTSSSGEATLWNAHQMKSWDTIGKLLWQRKVTKQMHVLDCDGHRLALWRNKGALEIQDGRSEKSRPLLKPTIIPDLFRFSPDGKLGVAGFGDGSLRIWDLATGKPTTLPFWPGAPVRQVAWSPDARFLASGDGTGKVRVWETATGLPLTQPIALSSSSARFTFSADGQALLTWSTDGVIQRHNLSPQVGEPSALARLVRVTVGQELHETSGSLIPLDAARLQTLWRETRGPE